MGWWPEKDFCCCITVLCISVTKRLPFLGGCILLLEASREESPGMKSSDLIRAVCTICSAQPS